MDNIKYRAMDVFRYALPGVLLIASFSLTISEVKTEKDIVEKLLPLINLKNGILLLFVGYFIGFCIDPIGKELRYKITHRIWKTPSRSDDGRNLTDSDRYILLRQFSEGNYSLVETWDMLKGMASNFAVGTLYLIFVLIYKTYQNYPFMIWDWIRLIPFAILLTLLLLYQSHNLDKWSVNDINAAIKSLNLEEKAKRFSEKSEESSKK